MMNVKKMTAASLLLTLVFSAAPAECGPMSIERIGDGFHPRMKADSAGLIHVISSGWDGVYHYRYDGASWTGGLIAGTGDVSRNKSNQPSLGISPDGVLHIVYGPTFLDHYFGVYWLTNGGTGWNWPVNIFPDIETEYLAIETDASATPLLWMLNVLDREEVMIGGAMWSRREGGSWTGPTWARNAEGKFVSMMRDREGTVHVAFRMQWIYHSVYSGGQWRTVPPSGETFAEILLPGSDFSMGAPSMTVTPDGTIHVVSAAWQHTGPGLADWYCTHVRYAFNDGTGWNEEHAGRRDGMKIADGDIPRCAITHDATGLLHVFCADAEHNLIHLTGNRTSWSAPETIDTGLGNMNEDSSPTFDALFLDGRIHTAYDKTDGLYHLSFEPETETEPGPEEAAEVPETPAEAVPESADASHEADSAGPDAAADAPSDAELEGEDMGYVEGGCGCAVTG